LFWSFLVQWFPKIAVPVDVLKQLEFSMKEEYLKLYVHHILKLSRCSID